MLEKNSLQGISDDQPSIQVQVCVAKNLPGADKICDIYDGCTTLKLAKPKTKKQYNEAETAQQRSNMFDYVT